MDEFERPMTPDERDAALDVIAGAIVARRMEIPAVIALEMHRPLSFIMSQGLVVGSPFLAPVVGLANVRIAVKLLEDRGNVERLICRIEELSKNRGAKAGAAKNTESLKSTEIAQ